MRTLVKSWALAGGLLAVVSATSWAQLPPNVPFKWWQNPRVVRELGLSLEQVERIESIWPDNRKLLIDLRAEHEKQQIDLESIISNPAVDEAAMQAKVDQLFKAKADVEKVTLLMRLRIRAALTPPQQEKSVQLFEQFRRQEMMRRNERDPDQQPAPRNPRNRPPQ